MQEVISDKIGLV